MINLKEKLGQVCDSVREALREKPFGPIVDEEIAKRSINIPAWTKFHPSLEAFEDAGFNIHGDIAARNLGARILVEAPEGCSAYSGGVVGIFRDEQGIQLAEYLTVPQHFGCTADLHLMRERITSGSN